MKPIEVTGKKIDDAIKEGLRLLGTTLDKVEYTVLSAGGLFKKAKISIAIAEEESDKKNDSKKQDKPAEDSSVSRSKTEQKPAETRDFPKASASKEPAQKFQKTERKEERETGQPSNSLNKKPYSQGSRPSSHDSKPHSNESRPSSHDSKPHSNESRPRSFDRNFSKEQAPKNFEESHVEPKRRAKTEEISEADVKKAVDFITELISLMGYNTELETSIVDGDLIVNLLEENGALIGYRGETLDAIEYLTSIQLNSDNKEYINIVVDNSGYRKKREKMLVSMAENAAKRCIKSGRKVTMEAMNRSSRRIVHSTLAKYDNIFTKSEGNEPNRHIILYFKREKR